MDLSNIFNSDSPIVELIVSVVAGLIVGFISGKTYEKRKSNKIIQKGDGNTAIQDVRYNRGGEYRDEER